MSEFLRTFQKIVISPFVFIIGVLIFLAIIIAKFLYIVYETFIPRGLRELVPILNLWRKYLVYISNLFSKEEKYEAIKIEEKKNSKNLS
ncbi:MAG: hypothetical protein ACTSP3_08085 [Candidatus Heimdallarchaeaceae archaeon]